MKIVKIFFFIILIQFISMICMPNLNHHIHADPTEKITIFPSDDADIKQRIPHINSGNDTILLISTQYGSENSSDWGADTLVKFDLSSISCRSIITSATLHLFYENFQDTNPVGRNISCHRILDDWNEQSVSWNSKPLDFSIASSSTIIPAENKKWIEWDVTEDVISYLNRSNDNYGWILKDTGYWGKEYIPQIGLASKEGDYSPYLEIKFEHVDIIEFSKGLIAYWDFNDGTGLITTDIIVNHSGTLHNASWSTDTPFNQGSSLYFDGTANVDFPTMTLPENFSISFWMKIENYHNCNAVIGFDGTEYIVEMPDSRNYRMEFADSLEETDCGCSSYRKDWNFNQWYHIVITHEMDQFHFYINGVDVTQDSQSCKGNTMRLRAFGGHGNPKHFFNGKIDDIRVYDIILDMTDIKGLRSLSPSNGNEPIVVPGDNLVGYLNYSMELNGIAEGGILPYSYYWDLNNDGVFNDAVGSNPIIKVDDFWNISGAYLIGLQLIDSIGMSDTVITSVEIYNTTPPEGSVSNPFSENVAQIEENQHTTYIIVGMLILFFTGFVILLYLHTIKKKSNFEPKIKQTETNTRCSICLGRFKKDTSTFTCECGAVFHKSCIKRIHKCPQCGTEYHFKKLR